MTFHLKSVHDDAEGITLAEAHVPMSALTPAVEGLVIVLVCSNPMQPATPAANSAKKPQATR